jgi:hypothetical protein
MVLFKWGDKFTEQQILGVHTMWDYYTRFCYMILKLMYCVSMVRITGPVFFEDTIYAERYMEQIFHQFFEQLIDEYRQGAFL